MASWRTSLSGILAIVLALTAAAQALLDGNPATNPDWTSVGAAVMAGLGLLNARDAKVSSEAQGVK